MDADPAPARIGGSVEPANRAAVAKERFQTPMDLVGERYELRDPFAEVTYRARTSQEMAAKAEQLGAIRFYAVDLDGKRTPINKVDGEWRRADPPDATDRAGRAEATTAPASSPTPARHRSLPKRTWRRSTLDAERVARAERLQAALTERYVIKRAPLKIGDVTLGQTEYRFKGDATRVAFTESTFRLSTDNNNPSVARSMVDVAEARNWQALRVSGHEDFKRLVWLEASLRGVKSARLRAAARPTSTSSAANARRVRSTASKPPSRTRRQTAGTTDSKQSSRGGGRKAVLAALEAVLVAKRVPERQRHAVMAAAEEKLAEQIAAGQTHRVKVYDKSAPPQRQPTSGRHPSSSGRASGCKRADTRTVTDGPAHARISVCRPAADAGRHAIWRRARRRASRAHATPLLVHEPMASRCMWRASGAASCSSACPARARCMHPTARRGVHPSSRQLSVPARPIRDEDDHRRH